MSMGDEDVFAQIVVASNDEAILRANLLASEPVHSGRMLVHTLRGLSSASAGFCEALATLRAQVFVFVHQDVLLPRGWDARLRQQLTLLPKDWAVAGVCGVTSDGARCGHVWSTGIGRVIGGAIQKPLTCVSLDEVLLVVKQGTGVTFDAEMPGFHLYGTDIARTAMKHSKGVYVIDAPVVHNSVPVGLLDRGFWRSYRYLARKWHADLPLATCIIPVEWPPRRLLWFNSRRVLTNRWRRPSNRALDPIILAERLQFDDYQGHEESERAEHEARRPTCA